MALRFQKEDEVDRATKEGRAAGAQLVFLLALFALIDGGFAWLGSGSLASYGKSLAGLILCGFVYWIVSPLYCEFRFRTKEIHGKVSAIEKIVVASQDDRAELSEKLAAIVEKLEELSKKVESLKSAESVGYSTRGIREGLRTVEARLNST